MLRKWEGSKANTVSAKTYGTILFLASIYFRKSEPLILREVVGPSPFMDSETGKGMTANLRFNLFNS